MPTDIKLLMALPELRKRVKREGELSSTEAQQPEESCAKTPPSLDIDTRELSGLISTLRTQECALEVSRKELAREVEAVQRKINAWLRREGKAGGGDAKNALRTELLHWVGWEQALTDHSSQLRFVIEKVNGIEAALRERQREAVDMKDFAAYADAQSRLRPLVKEASAAAGKLDEVLAPFQSASVRVQNSESPASDGPGTASPGASSMERALLRLRDCIAAARLVITDSILPQMNELRRAARLASARVERRSPKKFQAQSKARRSPLGADEAERARFRAEKKATELARRCKELKKMAEDSAAEQTREKFEVEERLAAISKQRDDQALQRSLAQNRVDELERTVALLRSENARLGSNLDKSFSLSASSLAKKLKFQTAIDDLQERNRQLEKEATENREAMEAMRGELLRMATYITKKTQENAQLDAEDKRDEAKAKVGRGFA